MEKSIPTSRIGIVQAALLLALLLFPMLAFASVKMTDIRGASHKGFDRLVIETSGETLYRVGQEGNTFKLTLIGAEAGKPRVRSIVKSFTVKRTGRDKDGSFVELELKEGFTVKDSTRKNPFRVILDIYPEAKDKSAKNEQKEAEKKPEKSIVPEPQKITTFNDGWRWIYRKKAVEFLRQEIIAEDSTSLEAIKTALNLEGADRRALIRGALKASTELKKTAPRDAFVLREIINFYRASDRPERLENTLRGGDSAYEGIGYFLLARYYEKLGFFPESAGYYALVLKKKEDGYLKSAALFHKGRLQFFLGRQSDAKTTLKASVDGGFKEAKAWLANSVLLKGEFDLAWGLYKEEGFIALDPVTLMSLGDIKLMKGEYEEARAIFETLAVKYSQNDFLNTFFILKKGDAYLAEGRREEAIAFYAKVKEKLKGEAWAVGALAMADGLSTALDRDSYLKALKLYVKVASGGYYSSELASIAGISMQIRLNMFEEALASIKSFHADFPASSHRDDARGLSGELIHRWTAALYSEGDYYGVAKVDAVYGVTVPFGKKAEGYLKSGRAAFELGMFNEAARNLDKASRIGNNEIAEEAMIVLGKVYVRQNDWEAAQRLYESFVAKYPRSGYRPEAELLLAKAAFLKGDYERVVAYRLTLEDLEIKMLRAKALTKLKRHKDAEAAFLNIAKNMTDAGDAKGAAKAYIGAADESFQMGRYQQSIDSYNLAIKAMTEETDPDRQWALYRIVQGYSKLNKKDEMEEALKNLKASGGELGDYTVPVFKDAKSL